jgi:hypothetical protein
VDGEEIHDGLAERGIDDAPADAGEEQAEEEGREARRERADGEARGADQQAAEQARPRAQPVGEPPARQREQEPGEVNRGNDQRELQSREAEAGDQAGREAVRIARRNQRVAMSRKEDRRLRGRRSSSSTRSRDGDQDCSANFWKVWQLSGT